MKRPLIIIPTFNHLEDALKPCLESIREYTFLDNNTGARVLVVANGCVDGTDEYLRGLASIYPWLHYVITEQQLGYTKAINVGLSHMELFLDDTDRVILLNNDVVLLEQRKNEWLEILESGFTHDKVALTGVILKNEEHTGIPFLIFFCVMIRRDMFDVLGKLDEAFSPGFGEDVDFCARAMKMGYDIVQVPLGKPIELNADNKYVCSFPIYHEGTKTFGEDPTYQTVIQRNIQLLIRKHFKIE